MDNTSSLASDFIAASQAGIDRVNRMYGSPTQHLQDRLKATNFILDHIGGVQPFETIGAREFIAMQLVQGALSVLRANEGQELNVLASVTSEVAALAATYQVVAAAPEPAKAATVTRSPSAGTLREFPPRTVSLDKGSEAKIMSSLEEAIEPRAKT